jgi:hypothetical protein
MSVDVCASKPHSSPLGPAAEALHAGNAQPTRPQTQEDDFAAVSAPLQAAAGHLGSGARPRSSTTYRQLSSTTSALMKDDSGSVADQPPTERHAQMFRAFMASCSPPQASDITNTQRQRTSRVGGAKLALMSATSGEAEETQGSATHTTHCRQPEAADVNKEKPALGSADASRRAAAPGDASANGECQHCPVGLKRRAKPAARQVHDSSEAGTAGPVQINGDMQSLRQGGNRAYADKDFGQAIECYTRALVLAEQCVKHNEPPPDDLVKAILHSRAVAFMAQVRLLFYLRKLGKLVAVRTNSFRRC